MSKRKKASLEECDEWINDEDFILNLEWWQLDWVPVRPESLTLYLRLPPAHQAEDKPPAHQAEDKPPAHQAEDKPKGTIKLTDDGVGRLHDSSDAQCGTINYRTGLLLLPGQPRGTECLAQYRFDSDEEKYITVWQGNPVSRRLTHGVSKL